MLMPGDSTFSLSARGDLVLGGVRDGGRSVRIDPNLGDNPPWFTLWTDRTSIDLFAAGGNLTPSIQLGQAAGAGDLATPRADTADTGGRFVYPSILRAAAPAGSIYLGKAAVRQQEVALQYSLLLAPSINGELELLAGGSIYAGGYAVTRSGADPSVLPTPFNPATMSNLNPLAFRTANSIFAFGPDTASGLYDLAPARFYAVAGDIVGLRTGELLSGFLPSGTYGGLAGRTLYEAGGPVWMKAGRDIVNSGTNLSMATSLPMRESGTSTGNLIVHSSETDVSIVSAGRDILYSSFSIAGPGALEINAGRNILMENRAGIVSIGPVIPGDKRPGASVYMAAGLGAQGPDYAALALRYLDRANLAVTGTPLAEQPGKAVKVYDQELAAWLKERYGFAGNATDALSFFRSLAMEQQAIFLRQVYFAELTAGGREYNDASSPRYQSYLRGREAIATLFPEHDANGNSIARGGDINLLTPAGRLVIGVEGTAPPSTAGLVTQGSGNIEIYSQGSVLLGLSRIMTTFGGDIIAWSAEGDINAGRGAKSTIIYAPPRRTMDMYGNVALAPVTPSSGAGIATLNPIAEVAPGDIDLIAPLGTIDAGEAGIRVSGNINLAALQVLNAANIQVQGTSSGIPTVQAPSIAAALSTSNATAATQQTAAPAQSGNERPSVIIVEVLGYGGGGGEDEDKEKRRSASPVSYDPGSRFQVIGNGDLNKGQRSQLTEREREGL